MEETQQAIVQNTNTSTNGESIESYYHRFSKLINDFKRNKTFSKKDCKKSQVEVNQLRAERLVRAHNPLALMANSNNPYNYPVFHQDQPSQITYMQQSPPNNNYNPQPSFNQNYMQQPMINPEDISDPTTAMNMALVLIAKAFKLNYSTPTNNNQRISSNPRNRQIAQPGMNMGQDRQMQMVRGNGGNQFRQYVGQNVGNQNGYNAVQNVRNQVVQNAVQNPGVQNVGNQNGLIVVLGIANQNANQNGNGNVVAARAEGNGNGNNENQIRCYNCRGLGHYARNCTTKPRNKDVAFLQTQLLIAQKEEAGIQLQAEEFDFMATAGDLEEIEEVNANCILMANLQQASTSGTQTDKAPVYDSEEQYTELLEPIYEPHQVQQNDINVISAVSSMEQSGGIVEQNPATVEETRTIVTLQRIVKPKMTLDIHNWSSTAHQELHKIVKDENFPIVNQVDARVQNFEIQFLKEAAKFVRDFKSLAKEADESLAKHKALEYEIERLLRAVVSHNIMSIVQNHYVVDTSNLQTELDRMKEKLETCIIKKEKEYVVLWNNWYKNVRNVNRTIFCMIKLIMTCKTKLNGCKLR
ncbi:gag-pol polyprotein [Tanacetum coccineum]